MLDKSLESVIINEIIFLTKYKLVRFYELYNGRITFEDFIFMVFEILESEHNFDNPLNYKAQAKMFEDLKSSKKYGIGKNLLMIQKKYNLSLEEMKEIIIKVFKIFYVTDEYKNIEFERKVTN